MKPPCSRRRFLTQAASALLLSAGVLPFARSAGAAKPKPFNPDSPKGAFVGSFTSENGMHTSDLAIKITKDKRIPQVLNVATLSGTIKYAGGKTQKLEGTFIIPIRRVSLIIKEKKGATVHTAFALDLSPDGTTLTGAYSTNAGGDEVGTLSLTRQ